MLNHTKEGEIMHDYQKKLIKNNIIFNGMIEQELLIIGKFLIEHTIEEGTCLIREGDHGDFICFVGDGEFEVTKKLDNGGSIQVAKLAAGHSLGEMSVVDGLIRSATVTATTDCIIFLLHKKEFDIILEQYTRIGTKILKNIAQLLSVNLRKTSTDYTRLMLPLV